MLKQVVLLLALVTAPLLAQAPGDAPDLAALARRIGSTIDWMADDARVLEEGRNREEVARSVEATSDLDRMALMDAALARARESGRLVLWYVPRILRAEEGFRPGRQMYRPAILDGYARAVFFTDPEIATLVNARTVPVRLVCDEALGARFGIAAPETVEPAILLIAPNGEVVARKDRFRTFNANWIWRVIANTVGPGMMNTVPPMKDPDALERMALRGNVVAASFLLLASNDQQLDREKRITARVALGAHQRRMGKLDDARATLAQARLENNLRGLDKKASRSDLLTGRIALETGRSLLAAGDLLGASRELSTVADTTSRPAARYHMALASWFQGKTDHAVRHLKEVTLIGGEGPWAIKAANALLDGRDRTPIGAALHGFEDPFFRDAPIQATSTAWPREGKDLARVGAEAVTYLLRTQRADGGWTDSRYAYWPSPDLTPNVWVSATAVSCAALMEWRHLDPERIDAAIARGERYLLDEGNMARGFQEEVYADLYKLIYLSKKHAMARDDATRGLALDHANRIVRELHRQQGTEGRAENFWGHEYPNGFTTAAVMNGMERARAMGARVTKPLLERGAKALVSIRDADGTYAYAAGRETKGDLATRLKDSMARSPISEAALMWAGHPAGNEGTLETAMTHFWTYLPRLEAIRTCDFHTDGQLGGFFFWHGLFHTSEAIQALPSASRSAHAEKMRTFLAGIAEQDGSFIDSHEMGKSYGTAMALLSIANVLDRKP